MYIISLILKRRKCMLRNVDSFSSENITYINIYIKNKDVLRYNSHHAVKTHQGVKVYLHIFVTWALDGHE